MKRFNLMNSAEVKSEMRVKKARDSEIILILLPLIIAFTVVYFIHSSPIKVDDSKQEKIVKLESLRAEYKSLLEQHTDKDKMMSLIEERNKLRTSLQSIKTLSSEKSVPLDLLIAIGNNITAELALTSINKSEGEVILEGIAQSNKSISDFMDTLIEKNVFRDITIKVSEYSDKYGPYKQKFSIIGVL